MLGSSERWKSNEGSREGEGDGSISVKQGSVGSLKAVSGSEVAAPSRQIAGTLALDGGTGGKEDEMCVDGLRYGPPTNTDSVGLQSKSISTAASPSPIGEKTPPNPNLINPENKSPSPNTAITSLSVPQISKAHSNVPPPPLPPSSSQPEPQTKVRKWKRNARDNRHQLKPGIATSPFQRLLEISKSPVKHQNLKASSPLALKRAGRHKKEKSPQKFKSPVSSHPKVENLELSAPSGSELKMCKRKSLLIRPAGTNDWS
ncbi:hypothetical protein Q3G72_017625 [Acer saccharum]|nr:hypothetical protein Q3G72_017625 [Acer saccharum]